MDLLARWFSRRVPALTHRSSAVKVVKSGAYARGKGLAHLPCHAGGRGFESRRSGHYYNHQARLLTRVGQTRFFLATKNVAGRLKPYCVPLVRTPSSCAGASGVTLTASAQPEGKLAERLTQAVTHLSQRQGNSSSHRLCQNCVRTPRIGAPGDLF